MMDMEHIEQLITAIQAEMSRTKMALDLLYEVVERTGNTREGYFSLRKLNDLGYSSFSFRDPEEYLMHLQNITATILHEVERLDG